MIGTDPVLLDDGKAQALMDASVIAHPDQARLWRFLRAGAAFCFRHDGETVELALRFGEHRADLAAARAAAWGTRPEAARGDDLFDVLVLKRTPIACLQAEA